MRTVAALTLMLLAACSGPAAPTSTPTAPPTATATATATASATPTASASTSASPSGSPSASPSASPPAALEEVFSDDFSDDGSGWGVGDVDVGGEPVGNIAYAGGALRFTQDSSGNSLWSRRSYPAGQDRLPVARVEGDVTFDGVGVAGMLCGGSGDNLVGIVVTSSGDWYAVEIAGGVTVLDQGELPEGAVEDGAPLHLTTDCVILNGALGLIGWIGEPRVPIASFTGDAGPDGFDRVAAYAEALEDGGFGLAVDNVVVSAGDDYRPTLEGELRSHVPPAIAAGCAETPTSIAEEGALFAIACPGENPGAEIFEYTLFNSRAAMEAAYQQRVTTYGATQNANDCSTGPDEDGYTIDGTPAGRVFCAAQQFGIRIDWTDTRLNILASATDFDGSYPDTHADWLTAGPDLQPRTAVVH